MFPLRVPFGVPIFDPEPFLGGNLSLRNPTWDRGSWGFQKLEVGSFPLATFGGSDRRKCPRNPGAAESTFAPAGRRAHQRGGDAPAHRRT